MSELEKIEPEDFSKNRHAVIRKEDGSTLIIFESVFKHDSNTEAKIFRFYYQENCYGLMNEGQTLAHGLSPTCAMICRAYPGDVIALAERPFQRAPVVWRYFRVGRKLDPTPLATGNRKLSYEEINCSLRNYSKTLESLTVSQKDVALVFSQEHPAWLRSILNAQLIEWHKSNPSLYYSYTRCLISGAEMQRCVNLAPYVALEKWSELLPKAQLDMAIRSSPAGAVRFSIENIPSSLRADHLRKNPSAALEQHSKLTDAELHICSQEDPRNALQIRPMLQPEQAAIVLANGFTSFCRDSTDIDLDDFRSEVSSSIDEFPLVWVTAHAKRFVHLVINLELLLSYKLSASVLKAFLENVELPEKAAVAKHIAASV